MTIVADEARASPRARLDSWLEGIDLLTAVASVTFLLTIFFGFDDFPFRFASQIAFAAVLLRPAFLLRGEFWLALSLVATAVLICSWSEADNHKYLFVYWHWVLTFAMFAPDRATAENLLRWHARFFLVFVFLVASAQKFFSPSYMSGEMFELKLLVDDRFQAFGHLVGIDRSIPDGVVVEMAKLRSPLAVFEDDALKIGSNAYVGKVAQLITMYDFLVQVAIGLLFVPARRLTDKLGHLLLLFFIFTTYLPAPVFGFGWTLAIYGFTLVKGRDKSLTWAYVAAFVAILLYQAPWRDWVLRH